MIDVGKLTLDELGVEIDKTLDKLERLQALYAAAQAQDQRRVEKLIKEYRKAQKRAEEEKSTQETLDGELVYGFA